VERLAVIDMGSNSWRLVVFDYEAGSRWWTISDEIREAVRIGAGLDEDGSLREDAIERGVHAAAVFDGFCRASGIERVETVATSAIRDAPNREGLVGQIREHTERIRPRLVDGAEEARYGYLAICNSTTLREGFGLDIGGGSIQAMRIEGRRLAETESLRLGSVRVSERFLPGEQAGKKQIAKLRAHAAEQLEQLDWWSGGGKLVGIGGTIRNLAAAVMKDAEIPAVDAQGFALKAGALDKLIDRLAAKPASERGSIRGIKPDRGDVILGGALVLSAAMKAGGFEQVTITEAGIREGVFVDSLLAGEDPPLFEDVRRASVENLAHRYRAHGRHAEHVAELSLEMFDGLREVGAHELGGPERELLWAACALHDVGVSIDYDDHHHHSKYLIQNAGLPGYTPRELILIALIARFHRKGDPDASELGDLAESGDGRRLRTLSAIIRLAEQFERSRDGAIASIEVVRNGGPVELRVSVRPGGDPQVPLWSARRNSELLAEVIDRDVEISVA